MSKEKAEIPIFYPEIDPDREIIVYINGRKVEFKYKKYNEITLWLMEKYLSGNHGQKNVCIKYMIQLYKGTLNSLLYLCGKSEDMGIFYNCLCLALIHAMETFDQKAGVYFNTWLLWKLRGGISSYRRNVIKDKRLIRVPAKRKDEVTSIDNLMNDDALNAKIEQIEKENKKHPFSVVHIDEVMENYLGIDHVFSDPFVKARLADLNKKDRDLLYMIFYLDVPVSELHIIKDMSRWGAHLSERRALKNARKLFKK